MARHYKNEGLNKAIELLTGLNIPHHVHNTPGGHLQLKVTTCARRLLFTAAATPSDHRAAQNFLGDVRRGLRQAGIQV